MWAYEFQGVFTNQLINWLQQYELPTDGSADNTDTDEDYLSNYQEWRAGTNPRDAASVLRIKAAVVSGLDAVLTWESVVGRTYFLERTTNLASPASFQPLARNIPGQQGTTSYTNRLTAGSNFNFYRIGVE